MRHGHTVLAKKGVTIPFCGPSARDACAGPRVPIQVLGVPIQVLGVPIQVLGVPIQVPEFPFMS